MLPTWLLPAICPHILTNVEASRCRSAFLPWFGTYNAGTVVAGGECTVIIRGIIDSYAEGTITNTASVESDVNDIDTQNNTWTIQNSVNTMADLYINKSASPDPVEPGQQLIYTITLDNLSTSVARNVQVTDSLPTGLTVSSALPSLGVWNAPFWTIDFLEAGATETLVIETTVNEPFINGSVLTNTVDVNSSTFDPDQTNNSFTITTAVRKTPISNGEDVTDTDDVTVTGPDPDPEPTIPTFTTTPNPADGPDKFILIDDEGVPLGEYTKTETPDGEYIYLDENGIPLEGFQIPKTGDDTPVALWSLFLLISLLGASMLLTPKKRLNQ